MGQLRVDSAASLLLMMLTTYVCEAALLRKTSASDFLGALREKRAARCVRGGCNMDSSESEEVADVNSDYDESSHMDFFGGSNAVKSSAESGTEDEGSGM